MIASETTLVKASDIEAQARMIATTRGSSNSNANSENKAKNYRDPIMIK